MKGIWPICYLRQIASRTNSTCWCHKELLHGTLSCKLMPIHFFVRFYTKEEEEWGLTQQSTTSMLRRWNRFGSSAMDNEQIEIPLAKANKWLVIFAIRLSAFSAIAFRIMENKQSNLSSFSGESINNRCRWTEEEEGS